MARRRVPSGSGTLPRTTGRAGAARRPGTTPPAAPGPDPAVVTSSVPIKGMTCRSCEQRVERQVRRLPDVVHASASAPRGRLEIRAARPVSPADVAAAVAAAGYEVGSEPWISRDRRTWLVAAAGAVLAVTVALLAEASGLMRLASGVGDLDEGGLLVAVLLGLAAGVSTCMALTGGLVLALTASHTARRVAHGGEAGIAARWRPHAAFHLGRIGGFGVLGALLGSVGAGVALPTTVVALLMVTVGVVMGLIGIRLTGLSPRLAGWSPTLPPGLSRTLGLGAEADSAYSDGRGLALGAATFFLPCGFTQAVQVYALSTGSPAEAGAIMALFAAGTAPGLLAVAGLPELAPSRTRLGLLQVVGVVVIGFAIVNGIAGMRLLGLVPAVGGGPAASSAAVVEEEGTQTLRTRQVADGYVPAEATLLAGMPTRWIVESVDPFTCAVFLEVPSLGISVTLEKGDNVIDLPPLEPGRVPFMCAMGMYVGHLDVVEGPSAGPTEPPLSGTVVVPRRG